MQYFDPRGGSNRCKIKVDFFQKWSSEMAYVLGFLYADGCIINASKSSRTNYIEFSSNDKDLLYDIKRVLQSDHPIHFIPRKKKRYANGKVYVSSESFVLRIGSKRMFNDLKKIGLIPNKSKIIRFPDVPKKYLDHFIRGYFDGDGCVHIQKVAKEKNSVIFKRLSLIFTSGSNDFLKDLSLNLKKFIELNQNNIYYSHRAYQLRYSTLDSIELFKFLYKNASKGTYLKRKVRIFFEYFEKRPLRVDKYIKKIFNNLKMAT
jgi:intein-encoded DNA endonuclease-like protein